MSLENKKPGPDIENIEHENDAEAKRTLLHGKTTGGVYVPFSVDSDGKLQVGGLDSVYLRLDTTNGPLTGALEIRAAVVQQLKVAYDASNSFFIEVDNSGNATLCASNNLIQFTDCVVTTQEDIKILSDSKKIFFGVDEDANIYHNGSNMYITTTTGDIYFTAAGGTIDFADENLTTNGILTVNNYIAIDANDVSNYSRIGPSPTHITPSTTRDMFVVTKASTSSSTSRPALFVLDYTEEGGSASPQFGLNAFVYQTSACTGHNTNTKYGLCGGNYQARLYGSGNATWAGGVSGGVRCDGNYTGTLSNGYGFICVSNDIDATIVTNLYGYLMGDFIKSGAGAVTNQYGFYCKALSNATNNYGAWFETTMGIYFRDTAIHIDSLDDGHLDLTADTSIDLNAPKVGMNIATPIGILHNSNEANALADTDTVSNYHLVLSNPANDTNEGVGIAFYITTTTTEVGSSIIFKRTDSYSKGELQFYTKQNADSNGAVTEILTLQDDGNVDCPAGLLNAAGGFSDNGSVGVDGSFTDADGNTLTISGGIITAITPP